jgi:hypothetical protein
MTADDRRAAEAYNAWLLLARHTSAASNKIYLWIYKGVDATIKHTIVAKTGDGSRAFMDVKPMFDNPSRMLQRKLVSVFFSGDFDTTKGLDMLITQIDDATKRINSMGMSPTNTRIVKDLTAILNTVDGIDVSVPPLFLSQRITRAAAASSPSTARATPIVVQAPRVDLSGVITAMKALIRFVEGVGIVSSDDKASALMRALITSEKYKALAEYIEVTAPDIEYFELCSLARTKNNSSRLQGAGRSRPTHAAYPAQGGTGPPRHSGKPLTHCSYHGMCRHMSAECDVVNGRTPPRPSGGRNGRGTGRG